MQYTNLPATILHWVSKPLSGYQFLVSFVTGKEAKHTYIPNIDLEIALMICLQLGTIWLGQIWCKK